MTDLLRHHRYRFPAEWEPHQATWVTWPHNADDWPSKLATIDWVYGEIVRKLASSELVRVIAAGSQGRSRAQFVLDKVGVDPSRVELFDFVTDRSWTRDSGPIFVERLDANSAGQTRDLAIGGFSFNAWANYDNFEHDAMLPRRAAEALGLPLVELPQKVVLEGGAIDVNGSGALLTTEECLLDPAVQVRNPGFDRADYERIFVDYLGATQTIWLGHGIAGDDTHGHVDDLCRFVNTNTVVLCQTDDRHHPSYRALHENRERLASTKLASGALEVVALPMPEPLFFDGLPLPASYANFYIANELILVPTFNDPKDREALGILAELFGGRDVVGIHAVDLVWGFGTLHCLTQQQPAL